MTATPETATLPHAPSDAALVRAARAGHEAALSALLSHHSPTIARLCRRLAGPSLGDDCAQDTLLLATLRLPRLREPEAFGAWLRGIAIHVCRRARARSISEPYPLPPPYIFDPPAPDDLESSLAAALFAADLAHTVRAAVQSLPTGQRDAITLFYLAGSSYEETAETLGIPIGALKTRLHKGRAALRHHLRLDDSPPTQRIDDRTLSIHESGHAVLLWAYGGRVACVAIVPRAIPWQGVCEPARDPSGDGPARDVLQMLMGGEAAVARALPHRPRLDQGDRSHAALVARSATGGDETEAALFVASALELARARLEDPVTWSRVERVAVALATRRELDADEFRTLVSA